MEVQLANSVLDESNANPTLCSPHHLSKPTKSKHTIFMNDWCKEILDSMSLKHKLVVCNEKKLMTEFETVPNKSLFSSFDDSIQNNFLQTHSNTDSPNINSTWSSWLKTCSTQSPATDEKVNKMTRIMSEDFMIHHQEQDYAHHKHFLHHHHHHHHHHHNNTTKRNDDYDEDSPKKDQLKDNYFEGDAKGKDDSFDDGNLPHYRDNYPHQFYHHHHHHHHHHHYHGGNEIHLTNQPSRIIIDEPIIGDPHFTTMLKHDKCSRCVVKHRKSLTYEVIDENDVCNSLIDMDDKLKALLADMDNTDLGYASNYRILQWLKESSTHDY